MKNNMNKEEQEEKYDCYIKQTLKSTSTDARRIFNETAYIGSNIGNIVDNVELNAIIKMINCYNKDKDFANYVSLSTERRQKNV